LKTFCTSLQTELDSQLQFIRLETEEPIKAAELSIEVLLSVIENLKKFTVKYKFRNTTEEILFFKTIKPTFI